MKKYFVLLGITLLAFTACQKKIIREVHEVETSNKASAAVYEIRSEDWATDDDSLSFSASFNMPELSDAIFDHGAVLVYLSFDDNIYEALPEVFNGIVYGAIHSPGFVTVDFHALDGYSISPPTAVVYAKIVLIDADKLALHPNVNLQDFNEVKRVFKLDE